jgi:hypothetical protein
MSNTKHTPGPWFVDVDPRRGMSWNRQVMSDESHAVCFMAHSAGMRPEEDAANASLIAAAPELLALAYEMKAFAEAAMQDAEDEGDALGIETWSTRVRNASAVITKATGQEGGEA